MPARKKKKRFDHGYYGNPWSFSGDINIQLLPHIMELVDKSFFKKIERMPSLILKPINVHTRTENNNCNDKLQDVTVSSIPNWAFNPKVQIANDIFLGSFPRNIHIRRLKELYAKFSIPQLLNEYGILDDQLIPPNIDSKTYFNFKTLKRGNFTPLWCYDNTEFDCRNADEWVKRGFYNGIQWPVPATAYLPMSSNNEHPNNYCWVDANALKYNEESKMYSVVLSNDSKKLYTSIPRIQIHFEGEDPREFVKRVKDAIIRRDSCEKNMLWNMYIDKIEVSDISDQLSSATLQKIFTLIYVNKKMNVNRNSIVKDIVDNYKRTMFSINARFKLSKSLEKEEYIELPNFEFERFEKKLYKLNTGMQNYKNIATEFRKIALLVIPKVCIALWNCNTENFSVADKRLYSTNFLKTVTLEEFENLQSAHLRQTMDTLKEDWLEGVTNKCKTALKNVKIGWSDITLSSYKDYIQPFNDLRKLMTRIQFMMEAHLRNIVVNSVGSYANLIKRPCISIKGIDDNFVWGGNLYDSLFEKKAPPLFLLTLSMNEKEPFYSTDPDKFEPVIVNIFKNAILQSHTIQKFHYELLTKIKFVEKLNLTSVGLIEDEITEKQVIIENNIRKAIIPLKAYCKEFIGYLSLFNTNVQSYVKMFFDGDPSVNQVIEEISTQIKMKSNLQKTLPNEITIGLFLVNLKSLKKSLINKRNQLANSLMSTYASTLCNELELCCEEYKSMYLKLEENPISIEQVFEIREWIDTLPVLINNQSEIIKRLLMDMEILDKFWWILEDDQLELKRDSFIWPHKIELKKEETLKQLEIEFENFKKVQFADESSLQDQVESISGNVSKLITENDLSKVFEIAVDVKKNWKLIKDLELFSQTLIQRQKLFGLPITPFHNVKTLVKEFEPYKDLWLGAAEFLKMRNVWLQNPLVHLEESSLEPTLNDLLKNMTKCVKKFIEVPDILNVANEIKTQIEEFKPMIILLKDVLNPGMKQRHWDSFANETDVKIILSPLLTFEKCLELGISSHRDKLKQIAENASKEYVIEIALDKMFNEWDGVKLQILPYKDTGTHIMKISDDELQMLDDHILQTQQLSFSPYKGLFEERLIKWEDDLRLIRHVIEAWSEFQKQWMYLEPIFASPDIKDQLPVESRKFDMVGRTWRRVMRIALDKPWVLTICPDKRLLDTLIKGNNQLNLIQKGLSDYLESKRSVFPRFYFLSDDELLEILSHVKNSLAVQPHLKKCFENIYKLDFESDLRITSMYSGEGENVKLIPYMYPEGTVENWLLEVEKTMKNTVKETLKAALDEVEILPRNEWVLRWPGQVVIAISQTSWTAHVEHGIQTNTLSSYYKTMLIQLNYLRQLVCGPLKNIERQVLSALIVIEVHARDVLSNLVSIEIQNVNEFDWISQLRYYWLNDIGEVVRAVNAQFSYGYEYLGCSGRLVITPLTDRCYLTLTGALHLKFGGAPAGPAGTGKTETTKDLAKALAIQCVVFNCSDQLDFIAMGKFFKGLASSGAWACFDEFNRIDIEVLSVIAQQMTSIQKALMARMERFIFDGCEIALKDSCAVFITMNPGYAGRTELPDNLKALFRPVAMMVPDYTLIAEISLFSFGFNDAKKLAGKITSTFKLSSEQLSSQDHYDFGMRAVKTVIAVAGNLKRENSELDEQQIVLRALRDVNLPKFLKDDLTLFNGIVSDLFPLIEPQVIEYGSLEKSIRDVILSFELDDVDAYVKKVIQLYETTVVRHGLMLVGPTGSGKTKCYEILRDALTKLSGTQSPSGLSYVEVRSFTLNPKSITMGQLYGEFDALTHEWTDGILSYLVRQGISVEDSDKRWYVFDGPVDALWIENMNSVLDDNKKLCLSSGEIMKITDDQTMMFEVEDLAVASPATVSRCGMVYLEPAVLGYKPFVNCWIKRLPELAYQMKEELLHLIYLYVIPAIEFVHKELNEIVISVESSLLLSCLNLMMIMFKPLSYADGKPLPAPQFLALIPQLLPCWIVFAITWSIGATCDHNSRIIFSEWLKSQMVLNSHQNKFPPEGLIYDYRLHDGGFTMPTHNGEPASPKWLNWTNYVEKVEITDDTSYSEIEVPTIDNVRSAFLIEMLLTNNYNVLCIGPTGAGKTFTIMSKLTYSMPKNYVSDFLNFSARTSANQTQDLIDSKLDRRRKGVFGPPLTKRQIIFIDDFNMPALETYGAQPPIELIRQWMDFGGWYDRKNIGEWKNIVDTNFIVAMGPPGGGRNSITPRILRHFHYLSFTEMGDSSQMSIFSQILRSWTIKNENLETIRQQILQITLDIYKTIITDLLPTPAKTHYTFNLRDLSKVFQGILMASAEDISDEKELIKLWYHENCRVYKDRLINDEDRNWFDGLLKNKISDNFGLDFVNLITDQVILFSDFSNGAIEMKSYARVTNINEFLKELHNYSEEYNNQNSTKLNLVFFMDAVAHVCRISRIIRQQLGNALLLGMAGSGRQSLTRLAAFIAQYQLFQIQLTKTYGSNEFKDDVKNVMFRAGLHKVESVFLFSDTQIKYESFMEDINSMLNSGDIPNVYQADELDKIMQTMRGLAIELGLVTTKANLFNLYLKQVKINLHCVITMSPIGETFRDRIRQFPALVNNCTIDWFSDWPESALKSVAHHYLNKIEDLNGNAVLFDGITTTFQFMQQSVIEANSLYLQELNRRIYITPTSYIELLKCYVNMLQEKKIEINDTIGKLQTGLHKLLSTAEEVKIMQKELTAIQPIIENARIDVEKMVATIETDREKAEIKKAEVAEVEAIASKIAEETQKLAMDAQNDLNAALPMLEAAENSLKALQKNDISEIKVMKRPPVGVVLVLESICIMKDIKPSKLPGKKLGQKIDDFWEPSRNMISDPASFLNSLINYDKESISEELIQKIEPYILNPNFQPKKIIKVSKACTSLCSWVHAIYKYYFVNKEVLPKKIALADATSRLQNANNELNSAQQQMKEVMNGLNALEKNLKATMDQKEELEAKNLLYIDRMDRALKLMDGLANERERWKELVVNYKEVLVNLTGDILICAGSLAYLTPFTDKYRNSLRDKWLNVIDNNNVPRSKNCSLISILGDVVTIRNWQLAGLPRDNLSTENAILIFNSRRWPLIIDPQGQANIWIKNLGKVSMNNLVVCKLTDKYLLHELNAAIRSGKTCLIENVGTELDPALDTLFSRSVFMQGGINVIKIGETTIPYHKDFQLFITTNLSNPHYLPEISTKVMLVNFTLVPSGLLDQLLSIVVMQERPDLEELRSSIVISTAQLKSELQNNQENLLKRLTSAEGSPVDDIELIEMLQSSKVKSKEIIQKVEAAEITQKDIDEIRILYIPVANRGQLLYFCLSELPSIDPMYQYSFKWFVDLFISSIQVTEKTVIIENRVDIINEHFTFNLFCNVCRSLFERNKLQFAILLCTRIMIDSGKIQFNEWTHFLSGGTPLKNKENPSPLWLSDRAWNEIQSLENLPNFTKFVESFPKQANLFQRIIDSTEPHREALPDPWNKVFDSFQSLIILKCFRPDKILNGLQDFLIENLGKRFVEPQSTSLVEMYNDSSSTMPLIFILSVDTDPANELYKFATKMKMNKRLFVISLGQGQGSLAESLFNKAKDDGSWVFFQNCHLSPSWMPRLEYLLTETVEPANTHTDFRTWLTCSPSPAFPVAVLQNGSKMTVEPPRGVKANLLRAYLGGSAAEHAVTAANASTFRRLLFSLCLFHGVCLERRKYGSLSFNEPYGFTDGDLRICADQLRAFLAESDGDAVPYDVLRYTAGQINYGGRVTDDWDRRCVMNVLGDFYDPRVLQPGHTFDAAGYYRQLADDADHSDYVSYIRTLPVDDHPTLFGLHPNADITFAQSETYRTLNVLLSLQPNTLSTSAMEGEDNMYKIVLALQRDIPSPWTNLEEVQVKYPVMYEESLNTVLVQELIRYNRLLKVIADSLHSLLKALKGLVVMTNDLEQMTNSLKSNKIPIIWSKKGYPSLKPLGAWVADLQSRVSFLNKWIKEGIPKHFWISGFFFPQAFLTGCLQNFARRNIISIDTIQYGFDVLDKNYDKGPIYGCIIYGLFLEGCRWNEQLRILDESKAKILYTEMPPIWLKPEQNHQLEDGLYVCPVYKTLTRAGTLSTTGHSTNFVLPIEIPSDRPQSHWIKRGVALICALDY